MRNIKINYLTSKILSTEDTPDIISIPFEFWFDFEILFINKDMFDKTKNTPMKRRQ